MRLWDVASGELRRTLEGHTAWSRSIAWSPDGGALASGSGDDTVRLWDYETATELKVYKSTHPTDYIIAVFFQSAMLVVDSLGTTKLGEPDIILDTFELDASATLTTHTKPV